MPELKIDNLFARRSIRAFTGQPLSDEQITTLLEAAMAAPSARNSQPWHFVVIKDPAKRVALYAGSPREEMARQASVVIIPCGDPAINPGPPFWVQDMAAATENLLIAVAGLGLGAVWCGMYPDEVRMAKARSILGIPENIMPFCMIPVGYPAEEKEANTKYQASRVHTNRW